MKRGQLPKHKKPAKTCPSCGTTREWYGYTRGGLARLGKKGRTRVRGEGSRFNGRKGNGGPVQSLRVHYKPNTTTKHVSRRFGVCPDPFHKGLTVS